MRQYMTCPIIIPIGIFYVKKFTHSMGLTLTCVVINCLCCC